jgi:5'-nucleotidase
VVTRPRAWRWLLVAVVLLAACAAPRAPGSPPTVPGVASSDGEVRITLLQINDVYTLEPVDEGRRGGLARLATLVKRIRRENPATVMALAGDTISPSVISTLLQGRHMIAGLNALGLDVATFGNHEFDFGPTVLVERMRESRFTWLSANVLERTSGRPFGGARGEIMLTLAGVRVGLFGLTTADVVKSSSPGAEVEVRDPIAVGREVSTGLRQRGAQIVVAVTHMDMREDRALAEAADVDVIMGGHEHEPLIAEEGKTLITKAGSDARYLVQVDLWLGRDGLRRERSWTFHEVGPRLAPDPDVAAVVKTYDAQVSRALDVVVGRTTVPLESRRGRVRTEETNLGNFITDAMRARMKTDVAVVNGGGIRGDRVVPPGPLSRRDVVAMLPFANVVVSLELTGQALRTALEQGVARREREGGGFLQVSGVTLTLDPARPAGQRVVAMEVGGVPLDPARRYRVAVPDYVAHGGDGITAFRDGTVLVDAESGPLVAEVLLQAVASAGTIAPSVEGRIRLLPSR